MRLALNPVIAFSLAVAVALAASMALMPAPAQAAPPPKLKDEVKDAIDRGIKFLRSKQDPQGSYGNYPGLTAMVLEAFAVSPRKYTAADGPFVRKATDWIASLQKPDGAIYDQNLPSYNTALSILALRAVDAKRHAAVIAKAQAFLGKLQSDAGEGYSAKDQFFGGIGYGSDERPDLSNLQLSLEALKESGFADKKVYENALVFLNRVQNRSESNDMAWAKDDGGFVYAPNESKAMGDTPFASYGSMTYAGIKSLMYCDVPKTDPRIVDGFKWIGRNWDLSTHPGMGDTGLFFYYQTLSKTLTVYGEPTIKDARGGHHDWYAELAQTLLKAQKPDGSWQNANPRYWEGNPILATARAILALSYGYERWTPVR